MESNNNDVIPPDSNPLKINMNIIQVVNDLKTAESHFNWLPQADLTEERQTRLLEKIIAWLNDVTDVEVTPLTIISQHFSKFVFESLLSKFDDASGTLTALEDLIVTLKEHFTEEEYRVISYMLICEKAHFWFLSCKLDEAQKYVDEMKDTYSPILAGDKCRATVLALKGLILGHTGQSEVRLELFREAVKCDSSSSDLYGYLYSSLRRVRREREYGSCPTEEEITACKRAYDLLDLKTSSVLLRMGTLFEELIVASTKRGTVCSIVKEMTREQMKEALIMYVKTAAEMNPNSISTNVKYGDILSHGVTQNLQACEEQFNYCLKQWPLHSQVLHKVGKFQAQNKRDIKYGLELLARGLEVDNDNFPCLMDFLRFTSRRIGRANDTWADQILPILDKYIMNFDKKAVFKCKLLQMKGSVLWAVVKNKDDAIECWIDAVEADPDAVSPRRKVLDAMSGNTVFQLSVNFKEVVDLMEKTLASERSNFGNPTRYNILETLLTAVKSQITDFPKADSDSNWRKKDVESLTNSMNSLDVRDQKKDYNNGGRQQRFQPGSTRDQNNGSRDFPRQEYRGDQRGHYNDPRRQGQENHQYDHRRANGNNGSGWKNHNQHDYERQGPAAERQGQDPSSYRESRPIYYPNRNYRRGVNKEPE